MLRPEYSVSFDGKVGGYDGSHQNEIFQTAPNAITYFINKYNELGGGKLLDYYSESDFLGDGSYKTAYAGGCKIELRKGEVDFKISVYKEKDGKPIKIKSLKENYYHLASAYIDLKKLDKEKLEEGEYYVVEKLENGKQVEISRKEIEFSNEIVETGDSVKVTMKRFERLGIW